MSTRVRTYPELPAELARQLAAIPPSCDDSRPCAVVLANGDVHERVLVQHAQSYISRWGLWPEDTGRMWIDIASVASIRASRDRLPPSIAHTTYEAGESGMGYAIFTLVFQDGGTRSYVTGNTVDFISYPAGLSATDIVSVIPHRGRDENPREEISPACCLYGTGTAPFAPIGG